MTTDKRRRWMDSLSAPPPLLPAGTTVGEAAGRIGQSPFGAVFLESEQGEIGLLTQGQAGLALHHGLENARACDLMEGADTTIPAGAFLSHAALCFARSGSNWLPVVDGEAFVGVVASSEILASLTRSRRGAVPKTRSVLLEGTSARARDVLDAIGREAHPAGASAYLVGGAVRDCLLGRCRKTPDLDVAVEGDAPALARAIAGRLRGEAKVHGRFGTATVVLAEDGLELNFARTRTETYAHAGALPRVTAAPLARDLARRDFTVNAMAVSLDPKEFGRLYDPFGGTEDLEARCLRALHPSSFVEDPTRVLRGARFAARLDFALSRQAERLVSAALKLGSLDRVSGDRVLGELERAFGEPDPAAVVALLAGWGVLAALGPAPAVTNETLDDLKRLDEALARIAILTRDLKVDRTAAFLIVLAGTISPSERRPWLKRLGLTGSPLRAIESAAEKVRPAVDRLSRGEPARPSEIRRLLDGLSTEAIAVSLALARDARAREAIEQYLEHLRSVGVSLTGQDLKALGYRPGPAFASMLDALLEARLDGLVATREAEVRLIQERFPR